MRLGSNLLFVLAVLILGGLFVTMMTSHRVAEGFAPGDPTAAGSAAVTPIQTALMQADQKTMQQNQANIRALPPGLQPAFPPDFLAKNNITDPIGSPLNPSNDQMRVETEFYAKNPKKPPTPLSLRDQLMFNYVNLPPDQQTAFRNLGQVAATNANMAMMSPPPTQTGSVSMQMPVGGPTMPQMGAPVEVAPDAPTSSWSRNGVQIVSNVPQTCAPFVQQTMNADGNYFSARVPAGMPQNAMSFPPASYSYTGPATSATMQMNQPQMVSQTFPPLPTTQVVSPNTPTLAR